MAVEAAAVAAAAAAARSNQTLLGQQKSNAIIKLESHN
jgi:hypothetical protein